MNRRPSGDNHKKVRTQLDLEEHSIQAQYPFTAIVGQQEMKLALLLNVIDPLVGGALLMGHRGTGKSTAVRALRALLPEIKVVSDCIFHCDPKNRQSLCRICATRLRSGEKLPTRTEAVQVVELPLGATEDRVAGTINLKRVLEDGSTVLEPGLLARANRGFLYVDEVNLLDDHLVDLLLDVAASGVNRVEREGISLEHPSKFLLIGSGNPEEGELRPQLLDRFGLHVEVTTESHPERRVEVVELRNAFDQDPSRFCLRFAEEQKQLTTTIIKAKRNLQRAKIGRSVMLLAAQICSELGIEGHRGELTLVRAARALAALNGKSKVSEDDLRRVAPLALRHRLPRNAFEESASNERIQKALQRVEAGERSASEPKTTSTVREAGDRDSQSPGSTSSTPESGVGFAAVPPATGAQKIDLGHKVARSRGSLHERRSSGKKRREMSEDGGRHIRSVSFRTAVKRIAVAATVRAMISSVIVDPSQRNSNKGISRTKAPSVLRYKLFSQKKGALFVFLVDTSGSMARHRMGLAKRAVLDLLRQSYLDRDRVSIVTFRGERATVAMPPSRSVLRARKAIESVLVGGSTPLSAGLLSASQIVQRAQETHKYVIVFTDGRANVPLRVEPQLSAPRRNEQIARELKQLGESLRKLQAEIVIANTQRHFESSDEVERLARLLRAELIRVSS